MKNFFSKLIAVLLVTLTVVGCSNDADIASKNVSQAADNFKVMRRIVFYNGITGEYMLTIVGLCSLGNDDRQGRLSVTCKVGENQYKKNFLGLSNNVTFFAEQVDGVNVSTYHYQVVFKPQSILPSIDLKVDADALRGVSNVK